MILIYAAKLNLEFRYTNLGVYNINNFIFKTFQIVLASFQVEDKLNQAQYF